MVSSGPKRDPPFYVYALYFIRRRPQALSGSAEEVESDNEGGSSEISAKMARYWGDLPPFQTAHG